MSHVINTLLGAVSKTTSLVRSGRSRGAVHARQLAILPYADAEQVSEDITLLLAV